MLDLATPLSAVPVPANRLGESPVWHASERALYWCDIPGRQLHRFEPASGRHQHWDFPCEPACCAPLAAGGLLLGMRDGLWRFQPGTGERALLAPPPYDASLERFNDGKADPSGRFWVGTIYEPRDPPLAALYRWADGQLTRQADGITTSNGLAWSPDGRTMYWSDTKAHRVRAFDYEPASGRMSAGRVFAEFAPRQAGQALSSYDGRPDGAAVDADGNYWCAMFEGQSVMCFSPQGQRLHRLDLPVRCPTMPCFGDDDLRTLYITTAREGRPEEELAAQPLAGCVLRVRVTVPGLAIAPVGG